MKRGKRHSRRLLTIKRGKHCVRFIKPQFFIRSKATPHCNRKEGKKNAPLLFSVTLFFSFTFALMTTIECEEKKKKSNSVFRKRNVNNSSNSSSTATATTNACCTKWEKKYTRTA